MRHSQCFQAIVTKFLLFQSQEKIYSCSRSSTSFRDVPTSNYYESLREFAPFMTEVPII